MRPGGISSSVVRSRSPKITMAAVRGIGVAVMTSRSGSPSVPLARNVARCPERAERDLLGEQRVGADDDADVVGRQAVEHGGAGLALDPARQQLHPDLA